MVLRYIIDGCNFIKRFSGSSPQDFEGDKRRLVFRLERYLRDRGVRAVVVFDSRIPSVENAGKLVIIHDEDADSRIISEVGKLKSPAGAAVVSDDRALLKAARAAGAQTMGVLEFQMFLAKNLNEGKKAVCHSEKPSPEKMSDEEIREWVNYFER